jgi:hypothetical protein
MTVRVLILTNTVIIRSLAFKASRELARSNGQQGEIKHHKVHSYQM